MNYSFERKLINGYILFDLLNVYKKIPKNYQRIKKQQDKNVRKLVKKAYKIPFYKERFDKAGVSVKDIKTGDDLRKLPYLTKDDYRAWMNEEVEKDCNKDCYIYTTSGSSGFPLSIIYSPKEKAFNRANWIRSTIIAGYNPVFKKIMCRKDDHASDSAGKDSVIQKLGLFRREFFNQYASEKEIVEMINNGKPDLLYMNKSDFVRVCLYCKNNNFELFHPPLYCPVGEKTDEISKSLFYEVLGKGIFDPYGSAETGTVMVKLFDNKEYNINYDFFVIDIVDDNFNPSEVGNVVITPLYKTNFPLINYLIGDIGECERRNGMIFLKDIKGRANDVFKYKTGEVTTFFQVGPVIAHFNDIYQIRFIQKSYDLVHIQCVRNYEASDKTNQEVEADLTKELNKVFKHPFELEFEWLDIIPKDKNGKIRMIVCEI